MNRSDELGVLIEAGVRDWQIFQRSANDTASFALSGRWVVPQAVAKAIVVVRVVREVDGEPVARSLDWVRASTRRFSKGAGARKSGTWKAELADVPAGGLYRIETALQLDGGPVEWGRRGDMVHHVGVGDVWVIAGQSNSEGHGKSPAPDAPELGVHVFRARGAWSLASHPLHDSTDTCYVPNRLGSNPSHSPWLAFGKTLKSEIGVPIGLIPAALGGSPLSAWDRGEKGPGCGVLFDNMLRYVADAETGVRGVVCYQGESDTEPALCRTYARRFRRFVADLRASFGNRQLPIITVQINRWVGDPTEVDTRDFEGIRQVQRRLAQSMSNVFILSTVDLSLSDGIHTNSSGNIAIGQRAASIALGGVYGHDVKYQHPDCRAAARKSARRIELRFDHVDERLHFESMIPAEFPFVVRDEEGEVQVDGWSIPAPDRFEIRLARPLRGRAVVVGAPTASPPMIVPQDISGHRPMLGFTQRVE
ncbi:MAG: sialate O-acetylesterase [Candidatus Latescibacterota bacterium]|nr:sialate O-acetylesterase [Candidatus Latescibacterota bacterium]